MSSKLNYLIGVSLKRKIKTKWFFIVNIILAIAIIGIINIDSVINFFGGDFNEKQKVYVVDNTNLSFDLFSSQLKEMDININKSEDDNFLIEKIDTEDIARKKLEEDKKAIAVIFDNDDDKVMKSKIISEGYIETIDYQMYVNAITNTKVGVAISKSNISAEEISKIYEAPVIDRIILDETKKSEDESMEMIMTTVFPAFILPFFILTIFLVQMIGAEVNDEKTTRGMEIIISNVSPKTHFFAKIFAGNFFILIQGLMLLSYMAIGLFIRKMVGGSSIVGGLGSEISNVIGKILDTGFGEKLIYIIPLTLLLMICTFVAYSILAGVLASMTTNTEDFQQIQTPIMIISMIGYFLATMAGVFNGSLFIRILSYVPLISAILSPSLLVLGQIGVTDIIISLIIVIITNFIFIKYGLKIYKEGILNYSSKGLWKKIFKAMKN